MIVRIILLFMLVAVSAGPRPRHPPPPRNVPHANHPVQVIEVDEGNKTDADLEPLYQDNLYPDIKLWEDKGPLNMSHIERLISKKLHERPDTYRVILIYNNSMYYASQPDNVTSCMRPCNYLMHETERTFKVWAQQVQFPNVLLFYSVADQYTCLSRVTCPAPVFSIAKRIHAYPPFLDLAMDVLVPKPPRKPTAFKFSFPWELKSEKAVWRGTRWCDEGLPQHVVGCSRYHMGDLYNKSEEARKLLDFGFSKGKAANAPPLSTQDFARYKFLLNLDGFTAAYRFSKLLLINSVILKEYSANGEYFYRSLKEYEHYLPVFKHNKTDILDVIREYQKPERQQELMQISKNAQEFSIKYCCPKARMLYWVRALKEYKKLFPDMDQAIETKWWPLVQSKLQAQSRGIAASPPAGGPAG